MFFYQKNYAQEKYHQDGNTYSVDELVKNFSKIDTLIKIDSQIHLMKKDDIEQKLHLLLKKADVLLNNYETESAQRILRSILDDPKSKKYPRITTETYLQLATLFNQTIELKEFKKYIDITEKHIVRHQYEDM